MFDWSTARGTVSNETGSFQQDYVLGEAWQEQLAGPSEELPVIQFLHEPLLIKSDGCVRML